MPPKLTDEAFIKKASLRHNNTYSYVEGGFLDMKSSVRVVCKEHGEFVVSSREHLFGRGGTCPKCRKIRNSVAALRAKRLLRKLWTVVSSGQALGSTTIIYTG